MSILYSVLLFLCFYLSEHHGRQLEPRERPGLSGELHATDDEQPGGAQVQGERSEPRGGQGGGPWREGQDAQKVHLEEDAAAGEQGKELERGEQELLGGERSPGGEEEPRQEQAEAQVEGQEQRKEEPEQEQGQVDEQQLRRSGREEGGE